MELYNSPAETPQADKKNGHEGHFSCPSWLRLALVVAIFSMLGGFSDKALAQADSTFCGKFCNDEYQIYIVLDIDSQSVEVPGQEFLGTMAGYLGAKRDSRLWFFTSAERDNMRKATVYITNDYGSEDLKATLTALPGGVVVLKQVSGSRIKIVVNHKWQKLPAEIEFRRQ